MLQKISLSVFVLMMPFVVTFAQSRDAGERDSQGRRTGLWKSYYGDRLDSETMYNAGLREGLHKDYWRSGSVYQTGQYAKDLRTGEWTLFHEESGNLKERGKYLNGKKSGAWEVYTERGTLRSVTNYLDGKKSGLYQSFWLDNVLDEKGNYLEDQKIGDWIKYDYKHETKETFLRYRGTYGKGEVKIGRWEEYRYLTNQLKKLETFDDQGVLHGPLEEYDYSGRLVAKGEMLAGKRDGTWTLGEEDGQIQITITYSNGVMNGPYEKRDNFRTLLEKGNYRNDKKDGEWDEPDPRGVRGKGRYASDLRTGTWEFFHPAVDTHPILTVEYGPNGEERSSKQYDEQNNLVKEISYNAADGSKNYKAFYPTGQAYEDGRFVGDKQEGEWKQYYEDGTVGVVKNFSAGVMNGEFKQFYPNGNLKMRLTVVNGKLWSLVEMKDINGNKLDGGSLQNGNGTLISYDENGNLQQVQNVVDGQVQQ